MSSEADKTGTPGTAITYRDAGVDTHAGQAFVQRIGSAVKSTHGPEVIADAAGFGGLFAVNFMKTMRDPVLVSSTDGVGTKLHLAQLFDRHDTVGQDLVAMCVNDLLATGARPLFFMDYIACGKLNPDRMAAIVESISLGCRMAGAALIGGETAEHPDTMQPGDYDLGGFTVGVVERDELLNPESVAIGDVLIGVPSSGVHSNGMSLLRRVFLPGGLRLPDAKDDQDFLLNEILLRPTIIYEPIVRPVLANAGLREGVRAMAHITGGGFYENIPRILEGDQAAEIDAAAWNVPAEFTRVQQRGGIATQEMYSVFNMGIGLVIAVAPAQADAVLTKLTESFAAWNESQDDLRRLRDSRAPVKLGRVIARESNDAVVIR